MQQSERLGPLWCSDGVGLAPTKTLTALPACRGLPCFWPPVSLLFTLSQSSDQDWVTHSVPGPAVTAFKKLITKAHDAGETEALRSEISVKSMWLASTGLGAPTVGLVTVWLLCLSVDLFITTPCHPTPKCFLHGTRAKSVLFPDASHSWHKVQAPEMVGVGVPGVLRFLGLLPRSQWARAALTHLGSLDNLSEVVHDGLDVVLQPLVVRLQQRLLALGQGSLLGHGGHWRHRGRPGSPTQCKTDRPSCGRDRLSHPPPPEQNRQNSEEPLPAT